MAKRSFPTKTLWSIMDPVSQQAAQLIVLHDEACAGLALPDLTAPVQGVQTAVQNLLGVCDCLLATSKDPQMQREMSEACSAVQEASAGLLNAAALLRADGRSEAGRKELGRHVHGLLSAMAALLFAWDDSEVRQAVSTCTALLEYMCDNAKHVRTEPNLRAFESSVSSSLSALLKRVRTRAQDLIAPRRAALLERASSRLEGLWVHLASALSDFEDSEPQELLLSAFVALGHELINALLAVDLEFDALRSREQQLRADQRLIEERAPAALAWAREPKSAPDCEQSAVWDVLRAARRIACLRERGAPKMMDLVDDVERLVSARLMGKEEEGELEAKLQDLMHACEEELEKAEEEDGEGGGDGGGGGLMRDVEENLCGEADEILKQIEDIYQDSSLSAAERQASLSALCPQLEERSAKMARAAERMAAAEASRDIRERRLTGSMVDQLLRSALQLRREARAVRTAALCSAPVASAAAEWRRCAAEVSHLVRRAGGPDLMIAVETAAAKAAEGAVRSAQEGAAAAGRRQVNRMVALAQWMATSAEAEAEEAEDEALRAEVAACIATDDFASEPLKATGTVMIDGGAEAEAVEDWRKASGSTIAAMARLRETVTSDGKDRLSRNMEAAKEESAEKSEEKKSDEAALERAIAACDVTGGAKVEAEELEDPKFDFPEAKEEEKIMNAAHMLHHEASCWDSEGNSLVAAAKRAAVHLASLHAAAQTDSGNKKVLIETSRALLGETNLIVKEAKKIAAACPDKRMASALNDLVTRLTTQNQQLKVVTAVKAAASGANDPATESDAYEQLSTNAEIIMRGVVDILRLAEAASIKIRVDSGIVMRWRRRG